MLVVAILNIKISPHRCDGWNGDNITGLEVFDLTADRNNSADTFMAQYSSDGGIGVFGGRINVRCAGNQRYRL